MPGFARRPRVAVLNSYNTPPARPGSESLRVRAFLQALAAHGFAAGAELDCELLDIEERPAMRAAVRRLVAAGVDLIQAFGAPNAMIAAEATTAVPIVYCGAHPEGIGEVALGAGNVTGKILALPFTASYKSFRLLRRLLPRVTTVWTAFFEDTMYVHPAMRALHDAARRRAGRRTWLAGGAAGTTGAETPVGFRTLAGLAVIIGVEYRELVFADAAELAQGFAEIEPSTGVFMNYNELLHCPGALEVVLRQTAAMGLPAIFNNNAQAAALGYLAGIGADWERCGYQCGEIAARILAGARPHDFPRELHADRVAWINLDTACRQGVELDGRLLGHFDRALTGEVDAQCM